MLEVLRETSVVVAEAHPLLPPYEDYMKEDGSLLSAKQYNALLQKLTKKESDIDKESPTFFQAKHMAERAGFAAEEIPTRLAATYVILREDSLPSNPIPIDSSFPRLASLCDQRVFAEALRLNAMKSQLKTFTMAYPRIFFGTPT